jgi:hypothetical protein
MCIRFGQPGRTSFPELEQLQAPAPHVFIFANKPLLLMWGSNGTQILIEFKSTMDLLLLRIPFMMGHFLESGVCHMRCPTMGLPPQTTPESPIFFRV